MMPTLHPYQEVAVKHLRANPRAGLFLDMGLGKTAVTLAALEPRHLPVLVVAPKRVTETVWKAEAALWRPDLRVAVAAGSPAHRQSALRAAREGIADIVVISRDNLGDAVPHRHAFNTFVMDELSSFKNRGSGRWRFAKMICKDVRHRWGLTGTPASNGIMDLWAQIYLLDDGERLYNTITKFRTRYFFPEKTLPNGVVSKWGIRPGADKRIVELISDICLSMTTAGRIELPPVTINRILVPLPPGVRSFYKKMRRELVADLSLVGGKGLRSSSTAGAMTTRLSQITAGFIHDDPEQYLDEDGPAPSGPRGVTRLHNEKLSVLTEIIEGTGSPVLVFYRFREERAIILENFPQAKTIDEPGVLAAWDRGEVPILLTHAASAGHGLNLQKGGHTAVWTTPDFDLELWEQGNKRLARQGQKNPVVIHVLEGVVLNKGPVRSIDSIALERLIEKKGVQDMVMDHLESPL